MRYLLILNEDPRLVATDEDRQRAVQRTGEYAMRLVDEGKLEGGAPLRPVSEARKVLRRGGRTRVLDGPFTEAKEVIAGYFVIQADTPEEAVELAGQCPNAEFGSVEVRQIVPMG